MAEVVDTCTAPFCRGEDRPGSVRVPALDETAGRAHEGSFGQCEAGLGSRSATRTGHRGVGGRYQHHRSARPHATFDQGGLDAPIAASAALRAIVLLARNLGLKSSTAIRS